MNQELLKKYSIPVPRYTSYPPANFFTEGFDAALFRDMVIESNRLEPANISIYIHIPFCFRMCSYCGCNAIPMKDKPVVNKYVEAVKKELRMIFPLLDKNRKISQIHYGGGTPTAMPYGVIREFNDIILGEFGCIDNPEIAIECHPGYMNEEYWEKLPEIGFNRVSIGIQDFDENVLQAVKRKKSRVPVETIFNILREKRVSVNMDFIYGLPFQTEDSFAETIEKAVSLRPERIVTFSYAHVPWVNPRQAELEKAGLPSSRLKDRLFTTASAILRRTGYKPVGIDHFVLPGDELYTALSNKNLHRNFQGYCARRTTGQVYAFGLTAISQLSTSYAQNIKDLKTYIEVVGDGRFPVFKGYVLNREEQITREIISSLMCNNYIRWSAVASSMNISVEQLKDAIIYDTAKLDGFRNDGIITYDDSYIRILPEATPFVRNVAASFDKLLLNTAKQFSKPV
jgi:oxygen-independent coproporphyrinogen-3 oxidase